MRPGDLVGAIANETNLSGRQIGPIRITDNHSVVGVPAGSVDTVVAALRGTLIRGKTATVRPYTNDGPAEKKGHRGQFKPAATGRAPKGAKPSTGGKPPRGGRSR
jgi:ATP-dependent RNA helicase DeaD